MTSDPDQLLRLAGAISDGAPMNWAELTESAASDADRDLIDALALLARIGTVHRSLGLTPSGEPSLNSVPHLTRWGDLTLLERVGSGAAGEVFRAYDDRLKREVALKLFYRQADLATNTPLVEGQLMARIRHPGVVAVYGAGSHDGRAGVWMEFVDGRTLAARVLDEGVLSVPEVVRIGVSLCEALASVHSAGLLHRDIKTHNVMCAADGRLMLMDFSAGRDQVVTAVEVAGTPLYLAPELFAGAAPSVQTDIYSVGVLLFHLLTGSYPVTAGTLEDLRAAHRDEPRRLEALRPRLPRRLRAAIHGALARRPADRFASATELADRLRAVTSSAARRRRRLAMSMALVMVAGAAIVWYQVEHRGRADQVGSGRPALASLSISQLGVTGFLPIGPPSPDGAFLPVLGGDSTHLWIVDTTGKVGPRGVSDVLTADDPAEGVSAAAVLPDGKGVLYSWISTIHPHTELRLVDVGSLRSQALFRGTGDLRPVGWTPNGLHALVWTQGQGDSDDELGWFDLATRRLTPIVTLAGHSENVCLSPDGRAAAYDIETGVGGSGHHWGLFITDLIAKTTVPILTDGFQNASPVWLPDGTGVAFASDRGGSSGLWVQKVAGNQPRGDPTLIKPNMGRFRPIGFTASGDLYYVVQDPADVYIADVDLRAHTVATPRLLPAGLAGINQTPAWSPDGSKLLYVANRAEVLAEYDFGLQIHDMRSGAERFIPVEGSSSAIGAPHWSPDGRLIVFNGNGPAGRGVYVVNVDDGTVRPVAIGLSHGPSPAWTADGRLILYIDRTTSEWSIYTLDPGTGEKRKLIDCPDCFDYVMWAGGDRLAWQTISPDGISRPPTVGVTYLKPPRTTELLRGLPRGTSLQLVGWSPDGAELIVARGSPSPPPAQTKTELLALPISGDAPRLLATLEHNPRTIRLSPTGRQIAFDAGTRGSTFWVMQGLTGR